MTKEEKLVVIDSLAEQLNEYPHFYITNIEALNAEQTASLRRKCFESDIKLVVVKNTLLAKALEQDACGADQGVTQDFRQAGTESGVRGRLRVCRRQPVGHSVQH